jgi:hypothetical protein
MKASDTHAPWKCGLKGNRARLLMLAPCDLINRLGRRYRIGAEPEVSIPEIVRRLPENLLAGWLRKLRTQSETTED